MAEYKTALVLGAGASGEAAAALLAGQGYGVWIYDKKFAQEEALPPGGGQISRLGGEWQPAYGALAPLAVLSPGISAFGSLAKAVEAAGGRLTGEIELAFAEDKGRVFALTGTNGKTTTTTLLGSIWSRHLGEESVLVAGNIGQAYAGAVGRSSAESVSVLEISSFQLETAHDFRPHVSAILNITPDHLDRHGSMENYASTKEKICNNQTKSDFCILNYEDKLLRDFATRCPAAVVWFSSRRELEEGFYYHQGWLWQAGEGERRRLLDVKKDFALVGLCNVENALAAIAMAYSGGVPMEKILEAVKDFRAVAHRIEYICSRRGVDYYNDSKATNPDAAIQGILAMERPTVLLAGGYDKGGGFGEWLSAAKPRTKALVLVGATAQRICREARELGMENIHIFEEFDRALAEATRLAGPGDAVLLSPACASWGMFDNYVQRGERFAAYARGLE